MSALVAAGWARSRFQSVSVVPMIQCVPHGMTNSTDFSVRRMIATSDTIRSRGTTTCTPLDARTRNRPRCLDSAWISSVHTPVAFTTTWPRTSVRRRARDRHRVPGAIDHRGVIADAADQRRALEAGRQPQRARARQMLLRRNGFRATELVVEEDTRGHIRPLPPPVRQREKKRQRLDQMRCQRGQRQLPFVQRLADQPELQLFEVAKPAVEHLRATARRAGSEVTGLDERDLQPAGRRVKGGARADHATADHDDVELLVAETLPGVPALLRAQQRLAVDRDRVAHFEWILVTRRYICPFTGYWVRPAPRVRRRSVQIVVRHQSPRRLGDRTR